MSEKKQHNYKATTVKPSEKSCIAAKTQSGKKLLLDQFDHLVLKHCREPVCLCSFDRHDDRRSGGDRRFTKTPIVMDNRRLNYGRRLEDIHNRARDSAGELDLSKAIFEFFQPSEDA